jgi:hypothetical protein
VRGNTVMGPASETLHSSGHPHRGLLAMATNESTKFIRLHGSGLTFADSVSATYPMLTEEAAYVNKGPANDEFLCDGDKRRPVVAAW